MYMANVKILRLVHNATYIPLTCVGGFALGDAKVLPFALGDAKVPNANGFALQWNIGLNLFPLFQYEETTAGPPLFVRSCALTKPIPGCLLLFVHRGREILNNHDIWEVDEHSRRKMH